MQSFDRSTFKDFSAPHSPFWPAFFLGSRLFFLFFIIASPVFLAAQSLSPRFDSSQVWLRAVPEMDSSFRLRAYFLNKNRLPQYLFWRSHTVRGFDKKRDSGDFVALPNDTTLIWEGRFLFGPNDPRSVNFYVIDNDLIVASAEIKFNNLNLIFPKPETGPTETTYSPTEISPEKTVETPPGLPISTADGGRRTADGDQGPLLASPPTTSRVDSSSTKIVGGDANNGREKIVGGEANNGRENVPKKLNLAKDDFEIDGILTSDVRTNFGRQFMANFNERWQPPEKMGVSL